MASAHNAGAGVDRAVVALLRWYQKHDIPIEEDAWENLHFIATQRKDLRAAKGALELLLSRLDPQPREAVATVAVNGPALIVWDRGASRIPPPSASAPMALSSGSSTTSSDSPSSSATADGARPPSASTTSRNGQH